jgi:hypothetical protein
VKLIGHVARYAVEPRLQSGVAAEVRQTLQDLVQRLLDDFVKLPTGNFLLNQDAPEEFPLR